MNHEPASKLAWDRMTQERRRELFCIARPGMTERTIRSTEKQGWDELSKATKKALLGLVTWAENMVCSECGKKLGTDVHICSVTMEKKTEELPEISDGIDDIRTRTFDMEVTDLVERERKHADGGTKVTCRVVAKSVEAATLSIPYDSRSDADAAGMQIGTEFQVVMTRTQTKIGEFEEEEDEGEDGFKSGSEILEEREE